MTTEKNDITMKKTLLILSALLLTAATSLRADGGMWMLGNLTKQTYDAMRAYGFSMTPEELSNDNGTSLRNAVVLFGGYCSGVVVSDNGLVFTNHHCGFESIQKHSTPEHDYVKDGFYAATPEEEWNVPGLFVSFPLREERVTDRVLPVITEKGADGAQHQIWGDRRNQLLDSMETVLVKEVTAKDSTLWAELVPYYGANEFYVTVYRVYPDVRLVLAPPSSLGKFGGDTDNWVWPRETCDFSVFRIYAGKDNMPAPYSKDNVPYKPSRVAAVSLDGYKAGDFAMTLGFPGSTYRYLSSYGIEARMNAMNDEFIKAGSLRLPMWKAEMDADPALRLKYDSKYQTFSNTYKNSIGMNRSITMYGILDSKRKFEQSLTEWINADPQRKVKYGDVLENLRQAYPDYTLKRKQLYKSILNLNYDLQVFELVAAISHGDYSKEKGMRDELIAAVSRVTPAFGRGEVIDVNGSPVELLLVKNPMGFRLSLASFDPANADTMIAINDEYADGRDMSWLWDVDFTSLRASGVAMVSGVRAWDMALRLGYDQVPVADTNTDLEQAVTAFVNANPGTRKHIYCTYTAMLKTRAVLGRITEVRDAGVGK